LTPSASDTVDPPVRAISRRAPDVKKLLVLLVLAGVGATAWRKFQGNRAEEDLWTEATRDETLDLR
jgi:hypothetical protein